LSVLNGGLCPNSVTHEVVISPEYSFFIPNAFSPDGNGINDTFFGKGKGIIKYELMIFDRWGNFIFYADDINKGWDGKANKGAETAQQDIYVWKVNLTDIFNKIHSFIGTVTLVEGD
jgi:gliding motility-associated-like protein